MNIFMHWNIFVRCLVKYKFKSFQLSKVYLKMFNKSIYPCLTGHWENVIKTITLHTLENYTYIVLSGYIISAYIFTHIRQVCLTHWGRVTHICVSKLTIIGSDNGSSPERRQANIWTNAGILLIGTNFSEILSEIHRFPFKKMHLKTSYAKRRSFCLGLNVLIGIVNWGQSNNPEEYE